MLDVFEVTKNLPAITKTEAMILVALISGLVSYIVAARQGKISARANEIAIEKIKADQFALMRNINDGRQRVAASTIFAAIDKIIVILACIRSSYSYTKSFTSKNGAMSQYLHDKKYHSEDHDIGLAILMAATYFPKIYDDLVKLRGQMNIYWGYQRELLSSNENKEPFEPNLSKVLGAVKEIDNIIASIEYVLRKHGELFVDEFGG